MWCSGIPQMYGLLEEGSSCPGYMCILLYVKLIWCSGIPYMYGELEEGEVRICGVVVFHRSMVNWRGQLI